MRHLMGRFAIGSPRSQPRSLGSELILLFATVLEHRASHPTRAKSPARSNLWDPPEATRMCYPPAARGRLLHSGFTHGHAYAPFPSQELRRQTEAAGMSFPGAVLRCALSDGHGHFRVRKLAHSFGPFPSTASSTRSPTVTVPAATTSA